MIVHLNPHPSRFHPPRLPGLRGVLTALQLCTSHSSMITSACLLSASYSSLSPHHRIDLLRILISLLNSGSGNSSPALMAYSLFSCFNPLDLVQVSNRPRSHHFISTDPFCGIADTRKFLSRLPKRAWVHSLLDLSRRMAAVHPNPRSDLSSLPPSFAGPCLPVSLSAHPSSGAAWR